MTRILNTKTCYEIADSKPRFAAIPIGSFEQHGKHLPVTTDTLIASLIAKSLCDTHGGLLAAPITASCSHEHAGFPGCLSVSAETLIRIVKDLISSIEKNDITLTILVNGHGGNYVIGNIAQELNSQNPRVFTCPTRSHWESALKYAGVEGTISEDMHGGEIETSILLHAIPEVVRTDLIEDCDAKIRPFFNFYGIRRYTKNGIIGFPSKATSKKGALLLEGITKVIGLEVEQIISWSKGKGEVA